MKDSGHLQAKDSINISKLSIFLLTDWLNNNKTESRAVNIGKDLLGFWPKWPIFRKEAAVRDLAALGREKPWLTCTGWSLLISTGQEQFQKMLCLLSDRWVNRGRRPACPGNYWATLHKTLGLRASLDLMTGWRVWPSAAAEGRQTRCEERSSALTNSGLWEPMCGLEQTFPKWGHVYMPTSKAAKGTWFEDRYARSHLKPPGKTQSPPKYPRQLLS